MFYMIIEQLYLLCIEVYVSKQPQDVNRCRTCRHTLKSQKNAVFKELQNQWGRRELGKHLRAIPQSSLLDQIRVEGVRLLSWWADDVGMATC